MSIIVMCVLFACAGCGAGCDRACGPMRGLLDRFHRVLAEPTDGIVQVFYFLQVWDVLLELFIRTIADGLPRHN